jgi:hypothetical protein
LASISSPKARSTTRPGCVTSTGLSAISLTPAIIAPGKDRRTKIRLPRKSRNQAALSGAPLSCQLSNADVILA